MLGLWDFEVICKCGQKYGFTNRSSYSLYFCPCGETIKYQFGKVTDKEEEVTLERLKQWGAEYGVHLD